MYSYYFEFEYSNWKNKAGIFEYLTISRGGGGAFFLGTSKIKANITYLEKKISQKS